MRETNDNENLIKALNDILNANKTGQEQPAKEEKKQQHPQRRAPEQVRKNGMALRLMTARSA